MAELTLRQKFMKILYGMGLKHFGRELLADLAVGSPEWFEVVDQLLLGNDFPSRKLVLQQMTAKGAVKRSPNKQRMIETMMAFLNKGLTEEKRFVIKFVSSNLDLFPRNDDGFKAKIMALTREKRDVKLSSAAEALLPALGINLDDPNQYRQR